MKERNVLEILGKNMHDIRFDKNISIQELAKKANIDFEALLNFEAGVAGLNILQHIEIAKALGVEYSELTKDILFDD